jgi:hypothetical protein
MTFDPGSALRQRMIDMVARKLVPNTQRGHVFACRQFAADHSSLARPSGPVYPCSPIPNRDDLAVALLVAGVRPCSRQPGLQPCLRPYW